MKKLLVNTFLFSLLLLAASCEKKPEPTPPLPPTVKLDSILPAPNWVNPEEYDYSSSMTAVVKVDLQVPYPSEAGEWAVKENDMLGAFMGEVCCGVVNPTDGLFFLYITEPDNTAATKVSLRYYSTYFKNLFEAKDVFTFQNDTHHGSLSEPLVPEFTVIK